jgi:hypothetical protein
MADEIKTTILTQPPGERFAVNHDGGAALFGSKDHDALQHEFAGQIVHRVAPNHPLVHVVGWSEDDSLGVNVAGKLMLSGDEKSPIQVRMMHEFANTHHQTHEVTLAPVDHNLKIDTSLAQPIHHALQLRTPIQLRFCNAWLITSNYTIGVVVNDTPLIAINLTGSTRVVPQPCDDEQPCLPAPAKYVP